MLPNLIIPGAQKSGTTSVYSYLKFHPECIMSMPKEPSFFSKSENLTKSEKYEEYFEIKHNNKTPKIVGEASTSYMYEEYVPKRIYHLLGSKDVKFIFILRDPVERTLSAYWHLYKRSHELRDISDVFDFSSFDEERVLKQEKRKLSIAYKQNKIRIKRYEQRYDDFLWPFRYIENSLYTFHLNRYLKFFESEKMFIFTTESLKKNPENVFKNIAKFLGIDQDYIPSNVGMVYHKTYIPKKGIFSQIFQKLGESPIGYLVRDYINGIDNLYKFIGLKEKPKVSQDFKDQLELIFRKEKERFTSLLSNI